MRFRYSASFFFGLSILLVATTVSAAPKQYILTGKLTSNRGTMINIPQVGTVACGGVGLSNLTIMSGPGGKAEPAPNTPTMRTMTVPANAFGCAKHVAGKKITTT